MMSDADVVYDETKERLTLYENGKAKDLGKKKVFINNVELDDAALATLMGMGGEPLQCSVFGGV